MTHADQPARARQALRALGVVIVGAALARLGLLLLTAGLGPVIVDERHYHELASSLVAGRGFAWADGTPTSIRPPLYPAFVAAVWVAVGQPSLLAVRAAQALLSLAVVALTWLLARRVAGDRAALASAAIVAFYPPFLFSTATLLSEPLFMALALGALLASLDALDGRWPAAVAAGALCGLASLTRSILWPFPLAVAGLLVVGGQGRLPRRLALAVLLVAAHAAVLAPWAARNTALQGTPTIVDTMGGLNLWMANSDATPADRMWDAVHQGGPEAFAAAFQTAHGGAGATEGQKDKWGQREAFAYMAAHPGLTLARAVRKVADLWGLDREVVAGIQRGYYRVPAAAAAALAVASVAAYPALALLAVVGMARVRGDRWQAHALLLGLVAFTCLMHALVFGHPRYRLPLVPILAVYAGSCLAARGWRELGPRRGALAAAASLGLCAIWAREVLVRDADRLAEFVRRLVGA